MESPKAQNTDTVVPDNNKSPPLEVVHYIKYGMWNIKHEIISPKIFELLIKTEIKLGIALYLKDLYNHINMCINAVTILQEYLLP